MMVHVLKTDVKTILQTRQNQWYSHHKRRSVPGISPNIILLFRDLLLPAELLKSTMGGNEYPDALQQAKSRTSGPFSTNFSHIKMFVASSFGLCWSKMASKLM